MYGWMCLLEKLSDKFFTLGGVYGYVLVGVLLVDLAHGFGHILFSIVIFLYVKLWVPSMSIFRTRGSDFF